MNRQIAGWVTHRWVKWVVLAVMLVLLGGLGSFGSKLASVQENDVSSFLPADAESTRVIEEAAAFSDPDSLPAIVLVTRDDGLRPDDAERHAGVKEDLAALPDVTGV